MAISCPASATETCSERDRSFSVPATTITPQPMTKLPLSSAQRTDAAGAVIASRAARPG
jgi:hypothetical protein